MKKIKRAFSTLTCMYAGLDEVLGYAEKAGITGVEIRLDKQNDICGMSIDRADEIRAKFKAAGCVITDLATSVGITQKNDDALDSAKHCIDLAAAVGARGIRIFVGGSMKTFNDVPAQDLAGAAETVCSMCEYAKARGVEIWAETHNALSSAKALCEFCDTVKADNLKVLWDVLHSIEYRESPAESLRILGSRLAHVHLKDAKEPEDKNLTQYRHSALGEGTFPIREVVTLLSEVDYDGYISLEWEIPWRPELRDCYPDTDATLAAFNRWIDSAERD